MTLALADKLDRSVAAEAKGTAIMTDLEFAVKEILEKACISAEHERRARTQIMALVYDLRRRMIDMVREEPVPEGAPQIPEAIAFRLQHEFHL